MRTRTDKLNRHGSKAALLLWAAALLLLFVLFPVASARLHEGHRAERKAQLERALRRAAVACYAEEGSYPPSLEALRERCGVPIDDRQFVVYYSVFAENLMPDIVVLEKEHG